MSRKKEEFKPIGDTVRIYSCGPTVYSTQHIGNLRAYVFTDVLKKTIEFAGYKILDVMNLTDVGHLVGDGNDGEDKVERAARAAKTTPQEIAKKYTDQYFADCDALNIRRPKIVAPATEYIDDMIEFIKGLEKKGYTYITADGVYFDSSKCKNYNKLSHQPIEQNKAGARVDMGDKRNPADFALWKFVSENSLQKWASPWQPENSDPKKPHTASVAGCVGWHIECSAIARHHLGDTFDIHTGGVDHITIHHTNEIAQTESLTGKPMCNFWLHNEHMNVGGGKMSKSLGNIFSIADIKARGLNPIAFRYLCLLAHYRSQFSFTWDTLEAAQTAYTNLVKGLARHANAPLHPVDPKTAPQRDALPKNAGLEKLIAETRAAFFDDMNTAKAIGIINKMLKLPKNRAIYDEIIKFDAILSLDLERAVKQIGLVNNTTPAEITDLANKRRDAKKAKNFTLADKLRAEISTHGYEITDTADGYEIRAH